MIEPQSFARSYFGNTSARLLLETDSGAIGKAVQWLREAAMLVARSTPAAMVVSCADRLADGL